MLPASNPETEPPASEELVAYLDGELPPEECRRVEERLATDADYREQLRDLDKAWEALESLPATDADDNFARTTIEMVAVAAEREATDRAAQAAADSRKRYWRWALGGIAAAAIGFAAARMLMPNPNEDLLTDLSVIFQYDRLGHIEDVGLLFLRGLPAAVPLEQLAHDQGAMNRDLDDLKAVAHESRTARRKWIDNLSPEKKTTLAAQFSRFNGRTREEQRRLRNLEREIAQATDGDQLRKSLVAYDHWLSRRSSAEQEELRTMSTEERFKEIRHALRRDDERAVRHLSAEDAKKLRDEIYEIFEEREADYWREWRRDRDTLPRLEGPPPMKALMVLHWTLRDDGRDDRTRERLIKQLSPEAQANWNEIHERDRGRRWFLLWWWIREAMEPKWGPEELEQFFANDLNNTERERLLSMDSDEMQAQLEQLYLANKFGLRGKEEWLGDLGPRGGMPPGPPGPGGPGRGRDGRRRNRERGDGSRFEGPPPGGFRSRPSGEPNANGRTEPPRNDNAGGQPQPAPPPSVPPATAPEAKATRGE